MTSGRRHSTTGNNRRVQRSSREPEPALALPTSLHVRAAHRACFNCLMHAVPLAGRMPVAAVNVARTHACHPPLLPLPFMPPTKPQRLQRVVRTMSSGTSLSWASAAAAASSWPVVSVRLICQICSGRRRPHGKILCVMAGHGCGVADPVADLFFGRMRAQAAASHAGRPGAKFLRPHPACSPAPPHGLDINCAQRTFIAIPHICRSKLQASDSAELCACIRGDALCARSRFVTTHRFATLPVGYSLVLAQALAW